MKTSLKIDQYIHDDVLSYDRKCIYFATKRMQQNMGLSLIAVIERLGGEAIVRLRYREERDDNLTINGPHHRLSLGAVVGTPLNHLPQKPVQHQGYPYTWVCSCGSVNTEDQCPKCGTTRCVYR